MVKEEPQIVAGLQANDYEQKFIEKTRTKTWMNKEKAEDLNEKKPRVVILYKQGQSEKLRRILLNRFQVAIKPTNTTK